MITKSPLNYRILFGYNAHFFLLTNLTLDFKSFNKKRYNFLQENVTLIKEINDLRRELKIARTQVHDLETAIGVMRKQQFSDSEDSGNKDNKTMSEENNEMEKMIDMQKGEIRKLRVQIKEMETVINSRPPSGSRLPPVGVIWNAGEAFVLPNCFTDWKTVF